MHSRAPLGPQARRFPVAAAIRTISPKLTATSPPFSEIRASLPLGAPLADIGLGWDGVLRGVDGGGVPCELDPLAMSWNVLGTRFDAVAQSPRSGSVMFFRGAQYHEGGPSAQNVADTWPGLPDGFKLGVTGAATANGVLYLFHGARYVRADQPTDVVRLVDLAGWPHSTNWQAGVVDGIGSSMGGTGDAARVLLFRGDEVIEVDLTARKVTAGPQPLTQRFGGDLLKLVAGGFDGLLKSGPTTYDVLRGSLLLHSTDGSSVTASYPSGVCPIWLPALRAAAQGRSGALWGAGTDGAVYQHDGSGWSLAPQPAAPAPVSVAVGADGRVFAVTPAGLHRFDADARSWTPVADAAGRTLAQVAAADGNRVWVRDGDGHVLRYDGTGLTPAPQITTATDIAANPDGTLWHCQASGATVFRFLSEGSQPPQALPLGGAVTRVANVASSGFGTGYALGQAQGDPAGTTRLYGYDSPYVFKTSKKYTTAALFGSRADAMATGAGRVFVTSVGESFAQVAALDAQTGEDAWPFDPDAQDWVPGEIPGGGRPQGIVYDPAQQLLYVATTGETGAGVDNHGELAALDMQTGRLAWRYTATVDPADACFAPLLQAGLLCVGESGGRVHLVATANAAARQGQSPVPAWIATIPGAGGHWFGRPALQAGTVYVAHGPSDGSGVAISALALGTGEVLWTRSTATASSVGAGTLDVVVASAVFGGPAAEPAVIVNANDRVWAVRLADEGSTTKQFPVPQHNSRQWNVITSALAYADGHLFAGDLTGVLHVLDGTLTPVATTPPPPGASAFVTSNPIVLEDADENTTVLFARSDPNIWVFDVTSQNLAQIETTQSLMAATHYDPHHRILYGVSDVGMVGSLGQVFAIRVDDLIQAERSFVIESQLLQDYDEPTPGRAQAVARYQTHVTVVSNVLDPAGANPRPVPLARQSVKIWADTPATVRIDGETFQIDPNTSAAVETDGSGSFSVVSDAGDLTAPTLRLWAPFMDGQERIVVYPDRELHDRLAATDAQPGDDDPHAINLASARPYDGPALFPADQPQQAQQTAQAVRQLTASVGLQGALGKTQAWFGGPAPTAAAGGPRPRLLEMLAGSPSGPLSGIWSAKYVAYAGQGDLALRGTSYFPANVPASRPVAPLAPGGLAFAGLSLSPMTAADAAAAIDAMQGATVVAPGGFLGDLKHAWQDIKQNAARVERTVVSIADVVYAGITYVVGEEVRVVKAIVRDIEDVAAIIGSFFVQLGKDLAQVLQALSLFFDLTHILNTQQRIRGFFDQAMGHLGDYIRKAGPLAVGQLDEAHSTIEARFEQLRSSLGTGRAADQPGMGTTTHSALTVGPTGGPQTQPQAVQGMWAVDKLKQHVGQAAPSSLGFAAGDTDPLSGFLQKFVTDLTGPSGTLRQDLANAQAQFAGNVKPSNVEQLLDEGIADLLTAFQLVAEAGVDVVEALVDGLVPLGDAVADVLKQPGTIDIPVLSALWKKARNDPNAELSFVDLLALVAAIPVTYVYRAIDGGWPPAHDELAGPGDLPRALENVRALTAPVVTILDGILRALDDFIFITAEGVFSTGLVGEIVDWVTILGEAAENAFETVEERPELQAALDMIFVFQVVTDKWGEHKLTDPRAREAVTAWTGCCCGVLSLPFIAARDVGKEGKAVASDILGLVPDAVGPVKLEPAETLVPFVAPAADLAFGLAVAGLELASAIENWHAPGNGAVTRPSRGPAAGAAGDASEGAVP